MARHVYAIVIDCHEEFHAAEVALEMVADALRQKAAPQVRAVSIQKLVPMVEDERAQDPERTAASVRFESVT